MIESNDNRPWGVGHAVLAVFVGFMAVVVAEVALGPALTDVEVWRFAVPAQTLATVGLVALLASESARRRVSLGLRYEGSDLIGLPIGLGIQFAASVVLAVIVFLFMDGEAPTQEVIDSAATLGGMDRMLVVLGAGLLAPASEELVFRGVLLRALILRRGATFATYVSAAAFASLHLLDPDAWLAVPVLFVVGVVLAKQAIATGRLAKPFLTHAAFNLVAVASLFLVE